MGIKIVNQTNEQECGVCALTALHNHFYGNDLNKEQALEKSKINDSGMTIFDFEVLGSTLGLECESYELQYSEFINLKINNYFVLLTSINGFGNHYVIARKKKKYIEIYDSCSLDMKKLSYSDVKKIFLNVIILVKKKPNPAFSKVFGKTQTLLMFDLKFVLLNLGLSILILLTSVVSASILNYVIDIAIGKSSVNNLITICFIFVLFYFLNDLLTYISSLYMSRHVKNYFILFTSKILSCLEIKRGNFLNKVDKNWIFKVDECVYNISNYVIVEINKFITNIILSVLCICIIGILQYWLLIFVGVYLLIEFIFFLFAYRKKKELFLNIIRSENTNASNYKNLIVSLNNELWSNKRKTIIERIKNSYSNIYKNYSDSILFKNNSSLFKSLCKSITEIFVIGVMGYLIIKTNKLTIGKLTFVISAFGLYKSSISSLFSYFLSKLEFNVYWQVYKDLTTVGNVEDSKKFEIKENIKTISFKFDSQSIKLDLHSINKCKHSIVDLIHIAQKILINEKDVEISKQLIESFIVLDQNSTCDSQLLIKNIELNPEQYAQYLKYFQIDLNKTSQPIYHSIIINLLCLLCEKQKIIFIDDILDFIKSKDKLVVKQLMNKIKKNNYVFTIGKEKND